MGCCNKCKSLCGLIILVLGIIFLLGDLGIWSFWGINWWTAVFLVVGACKLCTTKCPECQKACKK